MFVKSEHTYTCWCTLDGVGTFAKEEKLELKWINLVKKKKQKGGHWCDRTWSSERPDASGAES